MKLKNQQISTKCYNRSVKKHIIKYIYIYIFIYIYIIMYIYIYIYIYIYNNELVNYKVTIFVLLELKLNFGIK